MANFRLLFFITIGIFFVVGYLLQSVDISYIIAGLISVVAIAAFIWWAVVKYKEK